MSRQSGYILTIKAFIPSPKTDFAKQAAAALAMDQITKTNTLPENFAEIAKITDISGKFGSIDIEEAAVETETDAGGGTTVGQDDVTTEINHAIVDPYLAGITETRADPEPETKPKRGAKAE